MRAGCSRYVRGRVGAAEHQSRPHLCSPSSAGDGSAAASCLTFLGRPCTAPAAAAMSGPGNKRAAGDGGSGPPEKLSREEKTTTTLIEPIRLGGISSTVRSSPLNLTRLPTLFSAPIARNLIPSSPNLAGSTLQDTVERHREQGVCPPFPDRKTGSWKGSEETEADPPQPRRSLWVSAPL